MCFNPSVILSESKSISQYVHFMYQEYFFTIGKHESIILKTSDLITFLSIDIQTLDFLIANDTLSNK